MKRILVVPIACVALSAACTAAKGNDTPRAAAPGAAGLSGIWKSDGYGFAFTATGDTLRAYEVTSTTCVPSFAAIRRSTQSPGVEATYERDGDVYLVIGTSDSVVKRIHNDGAASDIVVRRIPALPAPCGPPTADTPIGNFDVFAQTWAEHYILFDQQHADWPAIVAKARANVTAATTPEELYRVLTGMIAPFENAHTMLQASSIKQSFGTFRHGTFRVVKHPMPEFRAKDLPRLLAPANRQVRGALRMFCNDQLQYGHLDDSTGYLRILSENGYTTDGGFRAGLAALEAALDTVFTDPKLSGLVIDVRINFGGADPYGLALASRLATTEYVAYSKEARADPVDHSVWTPGQASVVRPSARPGFRGAVVELIGPMTISAGETTTQALMGRQPRVLRIGENTQGVFSDVLGRRMPNGWMFGLPNEVFRAADGRIFDGSGIPPDIEVPVFADADFATGRDAALTRAVAELHRGR